MKSLPIPATKLVVLRSGNGWHVTNKTGEPENWHRCFYTDIYRLVAGVRGLLCSGVPAEPVVTQKLIDDARAEGAKDAQTFGCGERRGALDRATAHGFEAGYKAGQADGQMRATETLKKVEADARAAGYAAAGADTHAAIHEARRAGFNEATTLANQVLEKVKEDAYHDGYAMGQRNAHECCSPQTVVDNLKRLLDMTQAVNASHLQEIAKLTRERDAANGYKAAEEKLNAVSRETIRSLKEQVNAERNARVGTYVFPPALKERDDEIKRLNGVVTRLQQTLHAASPLVGSEPTVVQVGDVWRSADGRVRCISDIGPGEKVKYQHRVSSGKILDDSASSFSEFAHNVGAGASVRRQHFAPAANPCEPTEGFMVGDVWTSNTGLTRTITEVKDGFINYQNSADGKGVIDSFARNRTGYNDNWCWLVGTGAILTRK